MAYVKNDFYFFFLKLFFISQFSGCETLNCFIDLSAPVFYL